MSSSSICSAYSRGGAIRRRGAAARSPVPYREQPMEYEPAVICSRCGRKAPWWISWSVANPGRRYYSCVEAQWHDDPTSPFLRVLLGDLRDRVWKLEDDVASLCTDGDAGAGASRVEMQKTTEKTARDGGASASIRGNLVRKGLPLVCGFLIFVSGLFLGIHIVARRPNISIHACIAGRSSR